MLSFSRRIIVGICLRLVEKNATRKSFEGFELFGKSGIDTSIMVSAKSIFLRMPRPQVLYVIRLIISANLKLFSLLLSCYSLSHIGRLFRRLINILLCINSAKLMAVMPVVYASFFLPTTESFNISNTITNIDCVRVVMHSYIRQYLILDLCSPVNS